MGSSRPVFLGCFLVAVRRIGIANEIHRLLLREGRVLLADVFLVVTMSVNVLQDATIHSLFYL